MKILVEILHGLGDTVCTLPMLDILRKTYPQAYIMVLTKSTAGKEIIEASHIAIDKILVWDIYKDIKRSLSLFAKLRHMRFDYGISSSITPVRKARLFMRAIHPKKCVGWQTKGQCFDLLGDRMHFVEANLSAVEEICKLPVGNMYPKLYADSECVQRLMKEISPREGRHIVGVCIGDADYSLKNRFLRTGKVYTRSWGIDHMIALVDQLTKAGAEVVLFGGKAEIPLRDTLQKSLGQRSGIHDFVGKTTIAESIALASLCDVVFGVDTGMQHIAAAAGTATVSVFGPTNPKTHGAYSEKAHFLIEPSACALQFCYGTKHYVECPHHRRCLREISVEQAFKVIQNTLNDL